MSANAYYFGKNRGKIVAMEKNSGDTADRLAATERLAYRLWEQRGKPMGSAEVDWLDAEQMLRERQSAPNILVCGIHEFTTDKHLSSGWTYFVLPSSAVADFCDRAARLLPAGVKEFSARKFRDSDAPAFEQFLRLIRDTIDQHRCSLIAVISNSADWVKDLYESSMSAAARGFSDAGVTDQKIVAIAQRCAPPLFAVQRLLQNIGGESEIELEVSPDSTTAPFAALQMLMHLHSISIARIFAGSFDAHASKLFCDSPRLKPDGSGVRIIASDKSSLVQASDVIGNSAAALAFAELDGNSQARERKAGIFRSVFGDMRAHEGAFSFLYPAHP